MNKVEPGLIKLLLAAVIIFTIGLTLILADMYARICRTEHIIMHLTGEHAEPCSARIK